MTQTEHRCVCGATLRYKQDLNRQLVSTRSVWTCKDCSTPVPGHVAEQLKHQHPV